MWTNVATVNKIAIFPKLTIVSNDLATLNSKSSFIPKHYQNWQILVAILNEFLRQRNH